MKQTLTLMTALVALTLTASAGDSTPWHRNTDAKRASGHLYYRGLTEWNLTPATRAAAASRRSSGFVATPAPKFSGAGTAVVPAGTIPSAGTAGSPGEHTSGQGIAPSPN